jgi:hypothetical protein
MEEKVVFREPKLERLRELLIETKTFKDIKKDW